MYPANIIFLDFEKIPPEFSGFEELQLSPMCSLPDMVVRIFKNHYFDILLISQKITLPTPINLVIMVLLESNFGRQLVVVRFTLYTAGIDEF